MLLFKFKTQFNCGRASKKRILKKNKLMCVGGQLA